MGYTLRVYGHDDVAYHRPLGHALMSRLMAFERQVAMVREKLALEVRLANLVQSNEDARALGTEGD